MIVRINHDAESTRPQRLQRSLDKDLRPFSRNFSEMLIENDDPVPFGSLAAFVRLAVGPSLIGRERQVHNFLPVLSRANLMISPKIPIKVTLMMLLVTDFLS
jgi:hypothetical protein